jgi:hypothetical protein
MLERLLANERHERIREPAKGDQRANNAALKAKELLVQSKDKADEAYLIMREAGLVRIESSPSPSKTPLNFCDVLMGLALTDKRMEGREAPLLDRLEKAVFTKFQKSEEIRGAVLRLISASKNTVAFSAQIHAAARDNDLEFFVDLWRALSLKRRKPAQSIFRPHEWGILSHWDRTSRFEKPLKFMTDRQALKAIESLGFGYVFARSKNPLGMYIKCRERLNCHPEKNPVSAGGVDKTRALLVHDKATKVSVNGVCETPRSSLVRSRK